MWRATVTSLLAHKLRLALTALAIVLGVAFVSGTLIYTDTVRSSFESVFGQITADVDLAVRGISALDESSTDNAFGAPPPVVTLATADAVEATDGVAAVERNVEGVAQLVDASGEPIGNQQGPPTLGFNAPTNDALAPSELRSGRYPQTADEVALDAASAADNDFAVGDTIQIAANGPTAPYEIVGVFGFSGGVDNLAGASVALFEPSTAFELFGRDGGYESVDVLAADGVDVETLSERLAGAVGDDYEVISGDELAAESQGLIDSFLNVFNIALLVFAGVSLFVGAFIINNTFAIIVAQRSRELALLRAVGASRRQVLGSVLLEALIVGVLASIVGVLAGAGVALALRAVLSAFGLDLPEAQLVFALRTAIVGLALGVVITMLSALVPALQALRVPPVAAMQQIAVPRSRRRGVIRTVFGVVVAGVGVVLLAVGLSGSGGFPVIVGGAVMLLLGAALLAQYVTRPLLAVIGWPLQRLGIRGTLAQENAVRNPRRTASTASALMIGLGLVTFALIFGASLRESTTGAIDDQLTADFLINSQGAGLPGEVEQRVADVEQVQTVAAERFGQMAVGPLDDQIVSVFSLDPDKFTSAYTVDVTDGDLADFPKGGLILHADVAEQAGVSAGDTIAVTFPDTGAQRLPVRAVFEANNQFVGEYFVDADTWVDNSSDDTIALLHIALAGGADVDAARTNIDAAVADFPGLTVQDRQEVKEQLGDGINQLLGLISALLGLSIVIALFGIANTLSLSVFERTRELGLLRAVGATRRQVRSVIRWESVLIAVLGATFGVVVGTVFGWMTVQALASEGFSTFAFPTVQVVVAVVVAAIAGILAAILPARRAAKVDMLRALAAN